LRLKLNFEKFNWSNQGFNCEILKFDYQLGV
jgi:hypothetical protein